MLKRLGERGAYDKEATDYGLHELEHFRFAKDAKQSAEPRAITGTAALLPYQAAATQDVYETTNTYGTRVN
jgi:hypothetical protein